MIGFSEKEHHGLKRAVIYARVSTKTQLRDGHGLESQELTCRHYAEFKGYEVADVFKDDITGSGTKRPAMQEMLAFMRKRKRSECFVVIIDDISRLARDFRAHLNLREAIEKVGGVLESPKMFFGDDPVSQYSEGIQALNAEFYRKQNRQQVISRMHARTLNGYYLFGPPFGYRFEKVVGHGKMIVPDEPMASIVKEALEGFATGRFHTAAEVRRFLEKFPAFTDGKKNGLGTDVAFNLLRRPLYAGLITVAKWNLFLHPGKHEPLISVETYQRIQDRLDGRSYARPQVNLHVDFPMRGIVNCASCDRPMTAGWSKGRSAKYPYYLCQTKGCERHRKSIRREKVEGDFRSLLHRLTPAPALLALVRQMLQDLWAQRQARAGAVALDAQREALAMARKSDGLLERLVNTDDPVLIKTYETQVKALETKRRALLESAKKPAENRKTFDGVYRTACAFLSNPCAIWDRDDFELRKTLLKMVFPAGVSYSKTEGYRTAGIAAPLRLLERIGGAFEGVVEPGGIEPPTSCMP
ncbi:recombinase family protein [Candidatus Phaeomarinobacter ectocarpi]|uniref:recombinase family protein n=1 Tax=Candidatus Phaeomarinibacter ectocarpi TaxID=1458461 RepID=UPI0009E02C70